MLSKRLKACFGVLLTLPSVGIVRASAPASSNLPERLNDHIGVGTHFVHWTNAEKALPLIAAAGIGWVRDDLTWSSVETERGVYHIPDKMMAWIRAVHANGLKLDLVLNGGNELYVDRFDSAAYALFAAYVATELSSDVDCLEILNEPTNLGFLKAYGGSWNGYEVDGSVSPWMSKYVALLNGAARAIKAANPHVKVIGLGSVTPANIWQIKLGISPDVDGIVDHPYSYRTVPEILPFNSSPALVARDGIAIMDEIGSFPSFVSAYREASRRYNGPVELWLTEFGYSTYQPTKPDLFAGFTPRAQAIYIQRRLVQAIALGVNEVFVYDFKDDGADPFNREHNFGIVDASLQPKPAYGAVKSVANALTDLKPCAQAPAIKVFVHDGPLNAARPAGFPAASANDVPVYAFTDANKHLVIALWSAERAGGDQMPHIVRIEISGASAISKVEALDLLTNLCTDVPFQKGANGDVAIDRLSLPDHPLLLSTDAEIPPKSG